MQKKFVRVFNPALILLVLISLMLTACSSSPPENIIKDSVVHQLQLMVHESYNVTDFKITNKYEKKIRDEVFYIYEYVITYTFAETGNDNKLHSYGGSPSGTIALTKRGDKWFFFSNIQ